MPILIIPGYERYFLESEVVRFILVKYIMLCLSKQKWNLLHIENACHDSVTSFVKSSHIALRRNRFQINFLRGLTAYCEIQSFLVFSCLIINVFDNS